MDNVTLEYFAILKISHTFLSLFAPLGTYLKISLDASHLLFFSVVRFVRLGERHEKLNFC